MRLMLLLGWCDYRAVCSMASIDFVYVVSVFADDITIVSFSRLTRFVLVAKR
jgi:hypothetical protein